MPKRVGFGEWLPDLPALGNPGVLIANDIVPRAMGYGPMESWVTLGESALALRARGAIGALGREGDPFNFAGDAISLYKIATSTAGRQGVSQGDDGGGNGTYSMDTDGRWVFLSFGNAVFATNHRDPIQFYDMQTSAKFADVSPDAPLAATMGTIGDHIIVGNTYDGTFGFGLTTNGIWWPARANPFSWPAPGTDLAISLQSGRQTLEGDGGYVKGIVSAGAEVGGVFQERAIWRMDYRGGDVIYELTRVETNRGLFIRDLCVPFGRRVFYCAEDGFYIWDYTTSTPIGKDKVNRNFFADLDANFMDRTSWVVDPDNTRIFIGYAGSGNVGGVPNKILVYDWALNRFSELDEVHEVLTRVLGLSTHLDATPAFDVDAATGSLDDRKSVVGAQVLGAYDENHILGTFTGPARAGVIETGHIELSPGRRSLASKARPLVDGVAATVAVAGLGKSNEAATFGAAARQEGDGKCPIRSDARYHRFRTNIPAGGFNYAIGLDVDSRASGMR